MKRTLAFMGVAFAVTVAVIFGARASTDALSIVVGVILGVLASVPTTLLAVYLLSRPRYGPDGRAGPPMAQQPPVVVISPPHSPPVSTPGPANLPALTSSPPPRRTFTIVGEESPEAD